MDLQVANLKGMAPGRIPEKASRTKGGTLVMPVEAFR
jgi:hypothetical protein